MYKVENSPGSRSEDLTPPDSPVMGAALDVLEMTEQPNGGWISNMICYIGGKILPVAQWAILGKTDAKGAEEILKTKANPEFNALFGVLGTKIEAYLHGMLIKQNEKRANVSAYLNQNKQTLANLLHYLVTKIMANLVTAAKRDDEGPISLLQTLERSFQEIIDGIRSRELAIQQIYERAELDKKQMIEMGETPNYKERDRALKEVLKPVAKLFLDKALPEDGKDLPATNVLWIRSIIFFLIKEAISDLVLQICHSILYPKLYMSKNILRSEEVLSLRLGKAPPQEELSNSEKSTVVLKNLEIDGQVQKFRGVCQTVTEDIFQNYLNAGVLTEISKKYLIGGEDEAVAKSLNDFFIPFCADERVMGYLRTVLSEMLFKVLVHQTELTGCQGDITLIMSHLLQRYAELAEGHFSAFDQQKLKGLYTKLEKVTADLKALQELPVDETELLRDGFYPWCANPLALDDMGAEEIKAELNGVIKAKEKEKAQWTNLLRENFKPLSQDLMNSLCGNSQEQLFYAVPLPYRKTLYALLEEQILPDLFLRLYRETKDCEFKKGKALKELNAIFANDVKADRNYIPGLSAFLAKWGAAYLPNYLF